MAGQALKALRKHAGLTQERLGELVGVHYTSIAGWETGRTRPSRNHVLKLEEVLAADGQLLIEYAYAGVTPFDAMRADLDQLADQVTTLTELVLRLEAQLDDLRER